jgi:hypothetical protein
MVATNIKNPVSKDTISRDTISVTNIVDTIDTNEIGTIPMFITITSATLLTILVLTISLAFSIASYVVAFTNQNAVCSENSLIPLATWLIVYASVEIASIVCVSIIMLLSYLCIHRENIIININLMLSPVGVMCVLWLIAWNIVGAVSLFRDSMGCLYDDNNNNNNTSLWGMTLAVLIWQWLHLFKICCFSSSSQDNNDEDEE